MTDLVHRVNHYAEAGVSFNDYTRMHTETLDRATHRTTEYGWAYNDQQVQRVVAARIALIAWARALPDSLEKLKALETVALESMRKNRCEEVRQSAVAAQRVGGLAAYLAALVYRSIRLGQDSVEVARSLGVTPTGVRQTLSRMNDTAKKLLAGTLVFKPKRYARRHEAGPYPRWSVEEAYALRKAGFTYREIGAKLGVSPRTIEDRFGRMGLTHKFPIAHRAWNPQAHKFPHREAMEMKKSGATYQEIAARYGVDKHSVYWALTRSPMFLTVEENREKALPHRLQKSATRRTSK